jgi:hypothetical protein
LAEEGVEVGAGAELAQGTGQAGGAKSEGPVGDALVGLQDLIGWQAETGQGGGAGVFLPAADARVLLRLFAAPGRGLRVHHLDGAGHRGTKLTRGLLPSLGEDPGLHVTGLILGEDARGVGNDTGPVEVDDPFAQGARRAGQPDRQVQGQIGIGAGRAAGQGQRGGHLIADELAQLGRERPRHGGRGPLGGPAARQLGDRGQQARGAPRLQPPPGPQHPDQLVIIQPRQPPAACDGAGQPGQGHPRDGGVKDTAGLETGAGARWRGPQIHTNILSNNTFSG